MAARYATCRGGCSPRWTPPQSCSLTDSRGDHEIGVHVLVGRQADAPGRRVLAGYPHAEGAGPIEREDPQSRQRGAAKKAAKKTGRKRQKMSAAAKKAVSQRMKKFWAERKKANKGVSCLKTTPEFIKTSAQTETAERRRSLAA